VYIYIYISKIGKLDVKSRHASLKENINDLDIDYYIEGSLSEIGGSRNINTRLVNAKSESILWDNQYPFGDDQILAYQDTIIKNILIELKIDHSENELTSNAFVYKNADVNSFSEWSIFNSINIFFIIVS
jgi:hypothetical protein